MAVLAKIFKGKAVKGKFVPEDPEKFSFSFLMYKDGTDIEVYHRKCTKPKSYEQCKYFFGVIVKIFHTETGENEEVIYDSLIQMFSRTITEKGWYITKTLSDMTTAEAEEFFEKCRQYGAECGFLIPKPNEVMMF